MRPDIKKPEDLRGKKVAVSGFGSLGDFLERYIIKKYGLEPGRDVVMLSIGTQPDRIQALINGVVDAADLSHPADTQAERTIAAVVLRGRTLNRGSRALLAHLG